MDRRRFLASIAAATVAVACTSDDESAGPEGESVGGSTTAPAQRVEPATPAASPGLAAGSFALGVASGDPLHDRVLLWTRLASAPTVVGA
ncbi:MAG TPA: hypothetical protein PLV93_09325, partial [Microthrixaceae bacterium]|nr:hypothetical protein [Microthrixaceae bacterium]